MLAILLLTTSMLVFCPDAEVDTGPREHAAMELAISPASIVWIATRTAPAASANTAHVVEASINIVAGV